MSYVEDRRIPYRAQCACGEGFLRYYKTSNGWGYDTSVELKCAHCQRKYRYEKYNGIDFLIPKELHFPSDKPVLPASYCYTQDERFILKNGKSIIEAIIADMTAPKHRYIKDLENNDAISFAQEWVRRSGKKSLKPMIDWLQATLQNYACLKLYNQPTTTFTPLETVQTGACTYKIFVYKSADISYNESAML